MDKNIKEVQSIFERVKLDPEMQRIQEIIELQEIEINDIIELARRETEEKLREETEKKVKEERKASLEEGIEKGREEGEKKEKVKLVKNMLNEGDPLEKISRVTGLSIEQIDKFNGHCKF
jgi:predicted transposase/invertase (TIGR01784 family)